MVENICNVTAYKKCTLPKHKNNDECILHCSKEGMMSNYHKSWEDLDLFKEKLFEYILESIFANKKEEEAFNKSVVSAYLQGQELTSEFLESKIKDITIVFNYIAFPVYDGRDEWDYTPLLQRLGKIHFNYCKFYVPWIELLETEVFFQDCEFYDSWNLQNYEMLQNVDNVIYQCCDFSEDISCSDIILKNSQFQDCKFQGIELRTTTFEEPLFINSKSFRGDISRLILDNCTHKKEFVLKHINIGYFDIDKSIFNSKFEMLKVVVEDMKIVYVHFKDLMECFNCTFREFYVYKTTYEDFVSFEFSVFGSYDLKESVCAKFEYVTFLSFVNFRSTFFNGGLLLSRANFKEYPNFLYADINSSNTDVETFRIIKHSFDKIGNTTEANKYFALEMDKQKKETLFWQNPEKKIILFLNLIFSRYGESYLLPLVWIFIITIFYTLTIDFVQTFTIVDITPKYHSQIEVIVNELNNVAKNIIPYKKFLRSGMEFISLIFLLLYSVFIYHFIVAVKRKTKR